MSVRVLSLLTFLLYTGLALHVLLHAVARRRALNFWVLATTGFALTIHTVLIGFRWVQAAHFPAVGLRDGASLFAWAIVMALLITYLRTKVDVLGLAAYPVATALMFVANLTPPSAREDPILKGIPLPVHATFAFLGYASLFVAFAMGILYLVQERELKSHSPRAFYYLVPSLERCDTVGGRCVTLGFVFLSLAIATGLLFSHRARGYFWKGDPKEWSALIAWILYVVLIVARRRAGWGGRRAAWLGVAAFAAVAFTFVWLMVLAVPPAVRLAP